MQAAAITLAGITNGRGGELIDGRLPKSRHPILSPKCGNKPGRFYVFIARTNSLSVFTSLGAAAVAQTGGGSSAASRNAVAASSQQVPSGADFFENPAPSRPAIAGPESQR